MSTAPLLESMRHWSPEQLLAVHDFCQMVSDTLWKHHYDELLEHLNAKDDGGLANCVEIDLPLSFDDELPLE
jgi:hypothetical protein